MKRVAKKRWSCRISLVENIIARSLMFVKILKS
jgi:hypothetical protein